MMRLHYNYMDTLFMHEFRHSSRQAAPKFREKRITATTETLIRSSCGTNIYLESKQRQSSKRCKKEMVPGLSCWLADHAGGEASEEQ